MNSTNWLWFMGLFLVKCESWGVCFPRCDMRAASYSVTADSK